MKASAWNKLLRAAALLCAAAVLFCACGRETPPAETTAPAPSETAAPAAAQGGSLTLPYTSLDPVNPYFCDSALNAALVPLVFQSLYYLDAGYSPVPQLAAEAEISPAVLKITLAEGAQFSDGAPVSAADVCESFLLAKEAPLYAVPLANVEACEEDGARAVVFTLAEPDVNALNLLTFPIARAGTAGEAEALPCGSGWYSFAPDSLRLSLTRNPRCPSAPQQIETVRLYDITDASSLMHLLDTGGIDCFFTDLSEGTAKRSFSGTGEVYLNNLVFLGVNHESAGLSDARIRRAISLAVSRSAICENAFLSHARAAFYPFNTSWDALSGRVLPAEETGDADPYAADALLKTAGAGSGGDRLYYTLICVDRGTFMPAAAAMLAEQLDAVNVTLTVELLDEEDFGDALKKGEYDFYLSEIKLTKNMDLSPFFSRRGAASFGLDLEALNVDDVYWRYRADEADLDTVLEEFALAEPFIPLLYRNGLFCYSRAVKGGIEAAEDHLFINLPDWSV